MKKQPTMHGFLKRKHASSSQEIEEAQQIVSVTESTPTSSVPVIESLEKKAQKEMNDIDLNKLERDPGLRLQIYDYPINMQDTVREAYMNFGPHQPILPIYPKSGPDSHKRSFQVSWFKLYPWLEYSKALDAAFCFPCFLYNKPSGPGHYGQRAFTIDGFQRWKKVGGKGCAFLQHMGTKSTSFHNVAQKSWDEKCTAEQRGKNKLRLMTSIFLVRWCAFQAVAFGCHNEIPNSVNKGNFLEMLEAIGNYSNEVKELFHSAPTYASYTSSVIQKDILNLISSNVRRMICEEISGGKFCILVDEAMGESHKEEMSIVLRFINKEGFVVERFFGLVHGSDTTTQTFKDEIYFELSHYNLDIKSLRGQGYNGASNMRCRLKKLQTLISNDFQYAYFVHCSSLQLQLALVAASQEVIALQKFFTKLSFVINVVSASSRRTDKLKDRQADEIAHMISLDELETDKGLNQMDTLEGARNTRWSSYIKSVSNLVKMFGPTCEVLLKIVEEDTGSIRGDADSAYEAIMTFEFIFILHLEKEIMEITDLLCQTLRRQPEDIFNALGIITSTKVLLRKMKDERWDQLLCLVKSFCQVHDVDIPDLSSSHSGRRARASKEHDDNTLEHHYRVDVFNEAIYSQVMEIDHLFSDSLIELLRLSLTLDPKSVNESFRSVDVCQLVEKFYSEDFNDHEKQVLKMQLLHYEIDVVQHADYKQMSSISELCRWLLKTRRAMTFDLIYRVISLILTLPVFTATMERSFSAMNIARRRLQNEMEDEFLNDSLVLYVEREIAEKVNLEEVVQEFRDTKNQLVPV